MPQIILFNKPYNVLSQFTDGEGRATLADYLNAPGFRPAGRLDFDSEGLLVLTDDGRLQQQIAHPSNKQWKHYLAQVEGTITQAPLQSLVAGVALKDGVTFPAQASAIEPPDLWPRTPPIRVRKTVTDSWLSLSICEGRNRQVRRMTAAVGFPTLRLVRVGIGDWNLGELQPGQYTTVEVAPVPNTPGRRRQQRGRSKPSRGKHRGAR